MRMADGEGILRAGKLHRFETDVFAGCIVVRVAGLRSSDPQQFGNKRRKLQVVVQGRFKREIRYSELRAGQQFAHPFTHAPSSWIVGAVMAVARAVSPCYDLQGPNDPRPGMTGEPSAQALDPRSFVLFPALRSFLASSRIPLGQGAPGRRRLQSSGHA